MNQGFIRNMSIGLVAGVLVASGYALKKILNTTASQSENQDLSYEMPRARSEAPFYSLAGRKAIRQLHSVPREAPRPMGNVVPATGKPADANATPKTAQAAKKPDAKKNTKTAQKKKPQMTVSVINMPPARMKSFDVQANGNNTQNNQLGAFEAAPTTKNPAVSSANDDDKVKMSAAQWRSLLFGQPTAKNGNDFLKAYQSDEVEETAFYQISEELLIDGASDRQKLGYELLKATPSEKSFAVLMNHYQEKNLELLRTEITATLKTYGDVARFPILTKLLYSADVRVVQAAQSLLTQAIAAHNQHNNGNGNGNHGSNIGRDTRAPGSSVLSPSQFKGFLPALRRLLTSNDPTVVQQAQVLLDSIQALRSA